MKLQYLSPDFYTNWFVTEFPDVQDDAGRSLPVTGASPAVRTYNTTGDVVSTALSGPPSSESKKKGIEGHGPLIAITLIAAIVVTVLLLGLIAFRVNLTVR